LRDIDIVITRSMHREKRNIGPCKVHGDIAKLSIGPGKSATITLVRIFSKSAITCSDGIVMSCSPSRLMAVFTLPSGLAGSLRSASIVADDRPLTCQAKQ
jgi:hypothetical protein